MYSVIHKPAVLRMNILYIQIHIIFSTYPKTSGVLGTFFLSATIRFQNSQVVHGYFEFSIDLCKKYFQDIVLLLTLGNVGIVFLIIISCVSCMSPQW